jgi:hypothetical protein
MQSTQTLDACLTRLEREVAEAVTVTNGTCAQASHAVVQLAVRRARTKARMLGGLDSGVALSALQVGRNFIQTSFGRFVLLWAVWTCL